MLAETVGLSFRAAVERDGKVPLLWRGWETERNPAGTIISRCLLRLGKRRLAQDGISALWLNKQTIYPCHRIITTQKGIGKNPGRLCTLSSWRHRGPGRLGRCWEGGGKGSSQTAVYIRITCGLLKVPTPRASLQSNWVINVWIVSRTFQNAAKFETN